MIPKPLPLLGLLLCGLPLSLEAQALSIPPLGSLTFSDQVESLRTESTRDWNRFPSLYPVPSGVITSGYAPERIHPVGGNRRAHFGTDLRAPHGTNIRAAAEGVVAAAMRTPQYGLVIEVDHQNGFITRYAHASQILVRQGQVVRRGEVIARSGATGVTNGPHLHYEVYRDGWQVDACPHLIYPALSAAPQPLAC